MTIQKTPSASDLVGKLRNVPIGQAAEIRALVAVIEQIDRDNAFLRSVQAARSSSKVKTLDKLRVILREVADYETADLIVSRLEATCAPAYAPPKASRITVQRRTVFGF